MLGNDCFAFETPNVIDPGDLPPNRPSRQQQQQQQQQTNNSNNKAAFNRFHNNNKATTNNSSSSISNGSGRTNLLLNTTATTKKNKNTNHANPAVVVDNSAEVEEYHQVRESAARLLRDIADLELNPQQPVVDPVPYDPYYGEDEDEYDNYNISDDDDDDGYDRQRRNFPPPLQTGGNSKKAPHWYATSLLKATTPEAQPFTRTIKLGEQSTSSKHLVRQRILRSLIVKPSSNSRYNNVRCWCGTLVLGIIIIVVGIVYYANDDNNNINGSFPSSPSDNDNGKNLDHSVRMKSLIHLLTEMNISNGIHWQADGTGKDNSHMNNMPQYQAAYWLANIDDEQRAIPEITSTTSSSSSNYLTLQTDTEHLIQRYALAVLYFATGGIDQWKDQFDFLSSSHECSWSKLLPIPTLTYQQYTIGVGCDSELNVRTLFIPDNRMVGTVPTEIGTLYKMNVLSFPLNGLYGTIPDRMMSMHDLLYLDLNYNNFSGTIPEFFGNGYPHLQVLGLSSNILMGSIPTSFEQLTSIKTIALDNNVLTGTIDYIRYWEAVEYVYLDRNKFTGEIDASSLLMMNNGLQMLRELDISDNKLYGTIDLYNLIDHPHTNLHILDLAHNNFTGQFASPTTSTTHTTNADSSKTNISSSLRYMSIRGNHFDGTIPSNLNLLSQLSHLDFHDNKFTGPIPNSMGGMASLKYVFLGNNKFTDIPPLSQLSSLRELSLTGLGLTDIRSWLQYIPTIQLLDLSYNNIDGTVPEFVWNLPDLQYLILNDNQLNGTIPTTGGQALKFLAVHHNLLSGDADHVCSEADDLYSITTDCILNCSTSCCKSCCQDGDASCFVNDTAAFTAGLQGSWEQKYTRSPYGFDPAILEEASMFSNNTDDTSVPSVIP